MWRKSPCNATTPRKGASSKLALIAISGLASSSMILASGSLALAQTPEPTPLEHATAPTAQTPTPTHSTEAPAPAGPTSTPTPTPAPQTHEATHTVVSGDTLWGIAEKLLGVGTKWPTIYDVNKSLIEKTAQTFGFESSENGHWIFPGTHIQVPTINVPNGLPLSFRAPHVVPPQKIPPCTHGTFLIGLRGTNDNKDVNANGDANLGIVIGPLDDELRGLETNGLTPYGVPYPAAGFPAITVVDPEAYAESVFAGVIMTEDVIRAHAQCKDEKIVIAGYSQGAQVARWAVSLLPADVRARISGIVLFGDPKLLGGPAVATLGVPFSSYCKDEDPICEDFNLARVFECATGQPGCQHFAYAPDLTNDAARFLSGLPRR